MLDHYSAGLSLRSAVRPIVSVYLIIHTILYEYTA